VGAVSGALWLASRRGVRGLVPVIIVSGMAFGGSLVAFGFSPSLLVSLPVLVLVGAGMMIMAAATNTVIQTEVPDDKRGRVMSFYTMAFFGMMPLGSLAGGVLGARIGAPLTVVGGGLATIAAVLLFTVRTARARRSTG